MALLWDLVSLVGNLTVMAICVLALLGLVDVKVQWRRRGSR